MAEGTQYDCDMSVDYGREIRAARLARKWSQRHLAEAAGVPAETVKDIESGKPHTNTEAVLDALGLVEVNTLMPSLRANFLKVIDPVFDRIPDDRQPVVLAAVLDVVARAAAGFGPAPTVGQINLVSGDQKIC